MKDKYLLDRLN